MRPVLIILAVVYLIAWSITCFTAGWLEGSGGFLTALLE